MKLQTLTKASALDCTTVWPVEPSRKMAWQDFMEWLRFQWMLTFYSILFINTVPGMLLWRRFVTGHR